MRSQHCKADLFSGNGAVGSLQQLQQAYQKQKDVIAKKSVIVEEVDRKLAQLDDHKWTIARAGHQLDQQLDRFYEEQQQFLMGPYAKLTKQVEVIATLQHEVSFYYDKYSQIGEDLVAPALHGHCGFMDTQIETAGVQSQLLVRAERFDELFIQLRQAWEAYNHMQPECLDAQKQQFETKINRLESTIKILEDGYKANQKAIDRVAAAKKYLEKEFKGASAKLQQLQDQLRRCEHGASNTSSLNVQAKSFVPGQPYP